VNDDAFLFGVIRLPRMAGQVVTRLEAGHVDFGAQPYSRACAVDGNVAATQNQDLPIELGRVSQANIPQETGVDQDAIEIRSRNGEANSFVSTDGDQNGVESLIEELVQIVDSSVQSKINAQIDDVCNLTFDDVGW
jgi:hypothetical protein